jgi:hypothetical protein
LLIPARGARTALIPQRSNMTTVTGAAVDRRTRRLAYPSGIVKATDAAMIRAQAGAGTKLCDAIVLPTMIG